MINVTAIFKLMSKQLLVFFKNILSKFQCGFITGYSTQHCLFLIFEKRKFSADNNEVFRALLKDMPKVFNCLSYDLHAFFISNTL